MCGRSTVSRTETVYKSSGFSKNNQTVEITEETDVYYRTSYEIKKRKICITVPGSFPAVRTAATCTSYPKGAISIIGGDSGVRFTTWMGMPSIRI